MKHNKKRNTAFLYESLVKELTKAVVRQQEDRKQITIKLIDSFSAVRINVPIGEC